MKRCFLVWYLFISVNVFAQNRSNIWELGNNPLAGTNYPSFGIDFNQGFADTFTVYRPMGIFITNASVCDSMGNLLFYTNGVYVANRNHDSLLNCNDFNPGYWTDFYGNGGLGAPQGILILPKPFDENRFGIFSITSELGIFYGKTFAPLHLSFSEVDMNLDGSLGGILSTKKNIHLVEDTIMWGRLTACKHGNGQDWWIITHKYYSDKYYKLLFTNDSIAASEQIIGNKFKSFDANGMAVFSPDGSKYAHLNINDTIDLLEFDRCSGEFYNPITLAVPDSPIILSATLGCQFSPNSRFLYVNSYRRLWQFDTWASDIQATMALIDTTNNFEDKFLQQLAPDGKIYISTFNSNGEYPFLNVISNPDSLGLLCNFEIAGLQLPLTDTNTGIPNFPNYDLGALIGSPCDSLLNSTSTFIKDQSSFRVAPNPSNEWLNIIYNTKEDCLLTLYDINGKQVASVSLFHYFKNRLLYVSDLPSGVYLAAVSCKGERVWSEKVVVQR